MEVFKFNDYKIFTRKTLEGRPRRGRGQYRLLAEKLRLSSVAVSQIFRGSRDLSMEQALPTAEFLHLTPEETDYYILLVQYARAGTQSLKNYYDEKIKSVQAKRAVVTQRVKPKAELSEITKAIFYSNWQYSAIRIASSVPGLQSYEALAQRLGLESEDVAKIGNFLLENGLCVKHPDGITMGPSLTLLTPDSPFINNHRRNWRLKGLERLQKLGPSDLFYSGFVSLSKKDLKELKREFVDLIAKFIEKIEDSPSETLACLNLDWFEYR